MDYKELINFLRDPEYCKTKDDVETAATAIETLLAEREAAVEYVPHNCHTCKWWKERAPGVTCCMAPENSGLCIFGEGNVWQWRGPTPPPDRERTEG